MPPVAAVAASLLAVALVVPHACGGNPSPAAPSADTQPGPSDVAVSWLRQEAVPFDWIDPREPLDDLEPFRQMIGDARVVALGEATHGTREFFQMKHRFLRFLAERMGFTAFAIEATWPEANRLDDYVRLGQGDPAVLLSGLYFWTWNTESVLTMIRWMRTFDEGGGVLGFYGFDMQYPGMAIDNIERFVHAVDPASDAEFWQYLECLAQYANDARGRFPSPGYAEQPVSYREACRQDLQWVEQTLVAREAAYSQASSPDAWARAVQSARVALQYEGSKAGRSTRDEAMAANALWLLDQLGPRGKIVLWAHNAHVANLPGMMGRDLRDALGDDLVVVGFSFGRGSLTAVGMEGSTYTGLATHTTGEPIGLSYEDHFQASGLPRFLLDLRNRDPQSPATSWLAGPRSFRSIGSVYDASKPDAYWYQSRLPDEFDIIVYIEDTTASFVLPFQYPSGF